MRADRCPPVTLALHSQRRQVAKPAPGRGRGTRQTVAASCLQTSCACLITPWNEDSVSNWYASNILVTRKILRPKSILLRSPVCFIELPIQDEEPLHIYIYIHMYGCMCVCVIMCVLCVCVCARARARQSLESVRTCACLLLLFERRPWLLQPKWWYLEHSSLRCSCFWLLFAVWIFMPGN